MEAKKIIGINYKIPAPKTINWLETYGSWEGFVKEIHKSIGRNLGGGIWNPSKTYLDKNNKSDNI